MSEEPSGQCPLPGKQVSEEPSRSAESPLAQDGRLAKASGADSFKTADSFSRVRLFTGLTLSWADRSHRRDDIVGKVIPIRT